MSLFYSLKVPLNVKIKNTYLILLSHYIQRSSIQFFCGRSNDKTSFHVQFEKEGCGLLREAFHSKGECVVSQKRGEKGKDLSKKTQ